MVLRGSKTSPEASIPEALEELYAAQARLEESRAQLDAARKDSEQQIAALRNSQDASLKEVMATLAAVQQRVQATKKELGLAEETVGVKEDALDRTIKQLLCGGVAGGVSRTVVAPIDRIKILQQTQFLLHRQAATEAATAGLPVPAAKYGGIVQACRQIVQEEGFLRLWRGNFTNCIRVVPYAGLQFTSYAHYKQVLTNLGNGQDSIDAMRGDNFVAKGSTTSTSAQLTVPQRLLAGSLAGATATTFTYPFDIVRLRLSTQPELKGMVDAARSIVAEGGLRSFSKGYVATLVSLSPFIALNFACFDTLKGFFYPKQGERGGTKPGTLATLGLGAASGIFAQSVCYPLDVIRRRMQLRGTHYTGIANAVSTIVRQEGFRGLYKGQLANVVKIVPNNAVRFMVYEQMRNWLLPSAGGGSSGGDGG